MGDWGRNIRNYRMPTSRGGDISLFYIDGQMNTHLCEGLRVAVYYSSLRAWEGLIVGLRVLVVVS
jgi:hypothetical protein